MDSIAFLCARGQEELTLLSDWFSWPKRGNSAFQLISHRSRFLEASKLAAYLRQPRHLHECFDTQCSETCLGTGRLVKGDSYLLAVCSTPTSRARRYPTGLHSPLAEVNPSRFDQNTLFPEIILETCSTALSKIVFSMINMLHRK